MLSVTGIFGEGKEWGGVRLKVEITILISLIVELCEFRESRSRSLFYVYFTNPVRILTGFPSTV